MRKALTWIFGILIGLFILALMFNSGSSRRAYRTARGAVEQRVEVSQDRIEAVADMAVVAVDKAVELAGDLPSQEAKADLVKQDIEEISIRLQDAAEARGDAAIERLDLTIEQFNQTLGTVEDAADEADSPAVQRTLDRIYGILTAAQTQITELLITAGQ